MRLLALKLVLTCFVIAALFIPFFYPSVESGVLREIKSLGVEGALIVLLIFLLLVYFYCKDLYKTLALIDPHNRLAKPKSVWLMFLFPYNFIEDFFIVYNVSASLKKQAKNNDFLMQSKSYGLYSGIGWCVAQIISLSPGVLGQVASLLALVLWLIHWRCIRTSMNALKALKISNVIK